MQQPELYIGNVQNLADEEGHITNTDTQAFLASATQQFVLFADKLIG